MELYAHNQKVYEEIVSHLNTGVHDICYVQGTGTGKSFVMMKLIDEVFPGQKVLVVIPKLVIEVNTSSYAEFAAIKERTDFLSTANFTSRERTEEIAKEYDVVFVDEAHHLGSDIYGNNLLYMKEIMLQQDKYFFGLTATPLRDHDGVNIVTFFSQTVYGLSIFECIKTGLMPKLEYITCSMELTPEEIREANVRYHVDIEGSAQLLQEIVTNNDKKSWLVYFARIEDMDRAEQDMRMLFSGYRIIKIDSRDSDASKKIAEIQPDERVVVLSVNILLEGLHLPAMDAIMLFRDTTSLIVFQQMIGRIMSIGSSNMPLVVDCSSTATKLLYKLLNPRTFEGDGVGKPREQYEFRDIVYTSLKNKKYFDISMLLQELRPVYNYHDIGEMQRLAKVRGGKCLSEKYISSKAKLRWECAKGHQWETAPDNILAGKWCPTCSRGMKSIEELQEYARSRGGRCISETYEGIMSPMEWECENKHRWTAPYAYIKRGIWCPKCANRLRTIDELYEIAKEKGGECLSDTYKGINEQYVFRCGKGHEWTTKGINIRRGSWCPVCAGKRTTMTDLHAMASEHGGKCLATEYKNASTKVTWECEQGHRFDLSAAQVKNGSWCLICKGLRKSSEQILIDAENKSFKKKITIEDIQKLAASHGGKCLSKEYVNSFTKMEFQCSQGHRWETVPNSINRGHWCPLCSKRKLRRSIADMQRLAAEFNGVCLSEEYLGQKTHLKWKCAKGHTWTATPITVKRGIWCPICRKEIEDYEKSSSDDSWNNAGNGNVFPFVGHAPGQRQRAEYNPG